LRPRGVVDQHDADVTIRCAPGLRPQLIAVVRAAGDP